MVEFSVPPALLAWILMWYHVPAGLGVQTSLILSPGQTLRFPPLSTVTLVLRFVHVNLGAFGGPALGVTPTFGETLGKVGDGVIEFVGVRVGVTDGDGVGEGLIPLHPLQSQ